MFVRKSLRKLKAKANSLADGFTASLLGQSHLESRYRASSPQDNSRNGPSGSELSPHSRVRESASQRLLAASQVRVENDGAAQPALSIGTGIAGDPAE
eukprot:629577-Amphidinium_carterae.1